MISSNSFPEPWKIYGIIFNTENDFVFSEETKDFVREASDSIIFDYEQDLGNEIREILFFPYGKEDGDYASYLASVQGLFNPTLRVVSITDVDDPRLAAEMANAIAIGGGNYELLFRETGPFFDILKTRIQEGRTLFFGWNSGAALLCPGFIPDPATRYQTFDGINALPFQVQSHFNSQPDDRNMTELFLRANPSIIKVAALPDFSKGGGIRIRDNKSGLAGSRIKPNELFVFSLVNNVMQDIPYVPDDLQLIEPSIP